MSFSSAGSIELKEKSVIFIRHAQSEENVKFNSLVEGLQQMRKLRLPSSSSVSNGISLLRTELDSELSSLGVAQVEDMRKVLGKSLLFETFDPQVIFHSPLKRARRTILGILPDKYTTSATASDVPIISLPSLREATPLEHVISHTLTSRIKTFVQHILECPFERIIVCGHSQFFKKMLKMNVLMRNVDVWAAELCGSTVGGSFSARWQGLRLLHRSDLAPAHPFDRVVGGTEEREMLIMQASIGEGRERHTVTNPNVIDDLPGSTGNSISGSRSSLDDESAEELMCRICMDASSTQRLIRPCKCSGSLAHVHISCLNQWRATSSTASDECSVCKFKYRIARTRFAELLMSPNGALTVAVLLILLSVLLSGIAVSLMSRRLGWDVAGIVYSKAGISPYWRQCHLHARQLSFQNIHAAATRIADSPDFRSRYGLSALRTFKAYLMLFFSSGTNGIWASFLCSQLMVGSLDTIITGAATVGAVGSAHYLHDEVRTILQRGGQEANHQLFFFVISLFSLGNQGMGRLGLVVGCAIAGREVYKIMLVHGRKAAQCLGEIILEPPHS